MNALLTGRHSVFHVEIFFCVFIIKKTLLYAYLSHSLLVLKGIRTFIFCKLFERDIRKEKLEEIGVVESDNVSINRLLLLMIIIDEKGILLFLSIRFLKSIHYIHIQTVLSTFFVRESFETFL